jgi:hypothetical protein
MRLVEFEKTGIFIGYRIDPINAKILYDWIKELGFAPVPIHKLHITLVDSNSPNISLSQFKCIGKVHIPVNGVKIRSQKLDDQKNNALVLRFESEYLQKRRQEIIEQYGLTGLRPLHPHISLSYKMHSSAPKETLKHIVAPITSFTIIEEFATMPDPNWIDTVNKESDHISRN